MRRAALISVEKYDGKLFDVAKRDRIAMAEALAASGYVLTQLPNPSDASHAEDFLGAFFAIGTPGDVVLVYLTGHGYGASYKGKLLLALDGFATTSSKAINNFKNTLFLSDLVAYLVLESNRQPLMLVGLYDACRTPAPDRVRSQIEAVAKQGEDRFPGNWQQVPTFVAYACLPPGKAYFDPDGLSYFTAATSSLILPTHPARSFDDVMDAASEEVMRLAKENDGEEQLVGVHQEGPAANRKLSAYPIFDGPDSGGGGEWIVEDGNLPVGGRGPEYPYFDEPIETKSGYATFRFCFPTRLLKWFNLAALAAGAERLLSRLFDQTFPDSSSRDGLRLTLGQVDILVELFNAGSLAAFGVQYIDVHGVTVKTSIRSIENALTPELLATTTRAMEEVLEDTGVVRSNGGHVAKANVAQAVRVKSVILKDKAPTNTQQFTWGVGRRKAAVARVRIAPGTGKIELNGRSLNDYFTSEGSRKSIFGPLEVANVAGKFDLFANCTGGGPSGQAGAIVQGLARALVNYDAALEPSIRHAGFMTRDSRMKERKKYGQRGARRKFQFSKR